MEKPIRKYKKFADKPIWSKQRVLCQKDFFVKDLKVSNLKEYHSECCVYCNTFNGTITMKNMKANISIPQAEAINLTQILKYVQKIFPPAKYIPTDIASTTSSIVVSYSIFLKVVMIYVPFACDKHFCLSLFRMPELSEEEKEKEKDKDRSQDYKVDNAVVDFRHDLYNHHPEWVLAETTINLSTFSPTQIKLESPLAKNLKHGDKIYVSCILLVNGEVSEKLKNLSLVQFVDFSCNIRV